MNQIFNQFTNRIFDDTNQKFLNLSEMKSINKKLQIEKHEETKNELRKLVGKKKQFSEDIGPHPDFKNLKEGQTEKHYIVSVFLDIKGSTKLATKMSLEQVRYIKNNILTVAIDIFQAFDAHIHRLQGDALFAFWGRKNMDKEQAIVDALNGTAFLQYFFSNDLTKAFEVRGYPPIKIRIGIDFGDDKDVLWSKYGIKNCSEITTTSIHTDLAAKLQGKAPANSTMIGNNIIEYVDFPEEFYSIKEIQKDNEKKEDKYIMKTNGFTYEMRKFEWQKYLKRFPFFSMENNKLKFNPNENIKLRCFYKSSKGNKEYDKEYFSNCSVLDKNIDLRFNLEIKGPLNYDEIIWEVNNRGKEVLEDEKEKFEMNDYKNEKVCFQETKYKGHHYMKCIIKKDNKIILEECVGVYIK